MRLRVWELSWEECLDLSHRENRFGGGGRKVFLLFLKRNVKLRGKLNLKSNPNVDLNLDPNVDLSGKRVFSTLPSSTETVCTTTRDFPKVT
jgi:hypothetical protein